MPCSTAFKGWIGIDSTYDLKGLSTDHWKRVMERHLFTDRIQENYRGTNKKNKWLEVRYDETLQLLMVSFQTFHLYSQMCTGVIHRSKLMLTFNLRYEASKGYALLE